MNKTKKDKGTWLPNALPPDSHLPGDVRKNRRIKDILTERDYKDKEKFFKWCDIDGETLTSKALENMNYVIKELDIIYKRYELLESIYNKKRISSVLCKRQYELLVKILRINIGTTLKGYDKGIRNALSNLLSYRDKLEDKCLDDYIRNTKDEEELSHIAKDIGVKVNIDKNKPKRTLKEDKK